MTSLFPAALYDGIVAELMQEEGYRACAYRDSLGHWTIGHGRCVQQGVGLGITRDEARALLESDVLQSVVESRRAFPWFDTMSASRQSVIVQLVFQMGLPKLKSFRKMIAILESEIPDYDLAALELLDSRFARQVPARAERLAQQLCR